MVFYFQKNITIKQRCCKIQYVYILLFMHLQNHIGYPLSIGVVHSVCFINTSPV